MLFEQEALPSDQPLVHGHLMRPWHVPQVLQVLLSPWGANPGISLDVLCEILQLPGSLLPHARVRSRARHRITHFML